MNYTMYRHTIIAIEVRKKEKKEIFFIVENFVEHILGTQYAQRSRMVPRLIKFKVMAFTIFSEQ